jgi:collagenase-like PrtC family protease
MKISLGPVLFNWPAEKWRDFYFRIADEADVDVVHLGEVVCAKRQPFFAPYLAEVAERLAAAGKRVVFSTLALVMNRQERGLVEAICAMAGEGAEVEVNDLSALVHLKGQAFAVGPFVNVYNELTVDWLARRGAVRICLPPELDGPRIGALAGAMREKGVEPEVLVFGRMPLALSARCYHARAHDLPKDGCQFVCGKDADGMDLLTMDGEPFLAVNGIQTLSHACLSLAEEVPALRAAGVGMLRLSPHAACDMVEVAAVFRDVAGERLEPAAAVARLEAMDMPFPFANGYYHGQPGAARIAGEPD